MRDAHQSLLATRVRTYDMLEIAEAYARLTPELFSLEMWGGATFDTAMRFMKECPWQRLADLRLKIPNILFQMLLRASNAVGYSNYPDNVVQAFVEEAAATGIDLFRVFDSLNWVPNMRVAMDAVRKTGMLCEAAICYTGDITDPKRTKYDLKYYVELAKELEKMGAHILAIKDMAGLCKPIAAERLIRALKQEIGIPIHFHTHDTAGIQAGAILKGAEVGLDIADGALAPMSGLTSQPNLNSLVEMFRHTERDTGLNAKHLDSLALYWEAVREFYVPFETGMMASTAEVYQHEMPGGQVTNLMEQAKAVGLGHRWAEICQMYADVNQMLGDIVKVTPSSKAVGDMAILLVSNNLTVSDILDPNRDIAFPESFVDLISGKMGQPPGGFPKEVQEQVLRGEKPLTGRPGESMAPADLEGASKTVSEMLGREATRREVLSHVMFPKVFREYVEHQEAFSDTSILPTPLFFYGLEPGLEAAVDIEQGKTLIMQFLTLGDPHPDGHRVAFFDLNGQPRSVTVRDASLESKLQTRPKADPLDPTHIGAPMPGMVVAVAVKVGDEVQRGAKLVTLEAMKMETTLYAERAGVVRGIHVERGTRVETGDLLAKLE
jgi:pyruvate carboxylase